MQQLINGLHHITALASSPQRNYDFYVGFMGLRFIKKTINFDAPNVYHLYYGDQTGTPGTIMTFFTYGNIGRGRKGGGQMTYTAFSIPVNSLAFWIDRLTTFQIPFAGPYKRFDETYLQFEDYDGTGVELVTTQNDNRTGWSGDGVADEMAVRGFHTVTLNEFEVEKTVRLLTDTMQYKLIAEDTERFRFGVNDNVSGSFIDVVVANKNMRPSQGAGSVHHVAFATETAETQLAIRENVLSGGYNPTSIIDRQYFESIYFREPGGVLFEIATNPPGFTVDETLDALGTKLQLPPWYEAQRQAIEHNLPEIVV
jgi:glyoxalase family protein